MILAKLYVLGQERELIWTEMNYHKELRNNGKVSSEVMGGLLTVCFASQSQDDLILRWLSKESEDDTFMEIDKMEEGKICYYNNGFDQPATKTWKFNDAFLVDYKEVFNAENKSPMQTIITISPAIQNYEVLHIKNWNISHKPVSEPLPYQSEEQEEEVKLKFIASFERLSGYDGEFGFDWMRAEWMKNNYAIVSSDEEALKKEFTPTTIHGEEYFVPWLSMFPKQTGVKLKLKIKIVENSAKDDDIIKLPSKSGIKFVPDQLKVSEANGKEITVLCNSPLSSDTEIALLDKEDKEVGKLSFVKNETIYDLNVKVVKVVRKASKERDLKGIDDALKSVDLNTFLNKNSLQQALVKTVLTEDTVLELDGEKLIEDSLLSGVTFTEAGKKVSLMFLDEYIDDYEKNSKHKGLLLFATILQKPGAAGDGQLWIANARNCSIFFKGLYQPSTYAHEIAHVLGCAHTFDNSDKHDEEVERMKEQIVLDKELIIEYKEKLIKFADKIKKAKKGIVDMKKYGNDPTAIKNVKVHNKNIATNTKNIQTVEKNIEIKNKRIAKYEKKIKELSHVKDSNQHVFTQAKSGDNFMDYISPRSARKSFSKWQWKTIQHDIKTYYS